jgi:hypothetical protein
LRKIWKILSKDKGEFFGMNLEMNEVRKNKKIGYAGRK